MVRALQGRLRRAGIASALLHESPGAIEEHDLDLAFEGAWERAWPEILETGAEHGYRPVLVAEYDVAQSWYAVFGARQGATLARIAVDLCGDARGIGKYGVPIRRLLANAQMRDGVARPGPGWEATYVFAKHVWKGIASSQALDDAAADVRLDPNAFIGAARHVVGRRHAQWLVHRALEAQPLLSSGSAPKLLGAIHARRAWRSPLLPLRLARRWIDRTLRPTGTWIVVTGPDGSGKSTLATNLLGQLAPCFRRSLHLHWSPGVLPRPGRLVGRPARDPKNPHDVPPHGRAVSMLALLYHWFDHLLGFALKVYPALVRSGVVVMERGYHDVVVDPRRYRLNVPPSLPRMLGRILPRPDLTIVLAGDPSLLHARKQELTPMEIARQQGAWGSIGRSLGRITVVDADGSAESVTGAALEAILGVRSETLAPTARRTRA